MNRGLLLKSLREVWIISALFGLALMIVEALLAYVLPTFSEQLSTVWHWLHLDRAAEAHRQ